jgi:hypothetical protein
MEQKIMIEIERDLTEDEELRRSTEWLHPAIFSPTQYGLVSNLEWCRLETERRREKGQQCDIWKNGNKVCIILKEKPVTEYF